MLPGWSRWLIIMVSKSPKDRVVGHLPNGRNPWLIHGGDPNHSQVLGWSSKWRNSPKIMGCSTRHRNSRGWICGFYTNSWWNALQLGLDERRMLLYISHLQIFTIRLAPYCTPMVTPCSGTSVMETMKLQGHPSINWSPLRYSNHVAG